MDIRRNVTQYVEVAHQLTLGELIVKTEGGSCGA